jgi:hypothetical protein
MPRKNDGGNRGAFRIGGAASFFYDSIIRMQSGELSMKREQRVAGNRGTVFTGVASNVT